MCGRFPSPRWGLVSHADRYRGLAPPATDLCPFRAAFEGCVSGLPFRAAFQSCLSELPFTCCRTHPAGLEPATLGSEDRCSVQLSYGCTGGYVSRILFGRIPRAGNPVRGLDRVNAGMIDDQSVVSADFGDRSANPRG